MGDTFVLTPEYVQQHRNRVHTYESFGRAIVELMMVSATDTLLNTTDKVKEVTLNNVKVTVAPVMIDGEYRCISVTLQTPFGTITVHG